MVRWRRVHLTCPDFDGTSSTPPMTLEEQAAIGAGMIALNRAPWHWLRQLFQPSACRFTYHGNPNETVNGVPPDRDVTEPTNSLFHWFSPEPAERREITSRWTCTTHGSHPEIWAQRDAANRRTDPLIRIKYRQERISLQRIWELGRPGEPWPAGAWNVRRDGSISVWVSNRPPTKTLHNIWPRQ